MPHDQLFAACFRLGQPDDVQKLSVKGLVERVAVVGKRQFEQVFGREQLVKRDELLFVRTRLIVAQIDIGKRERFAQLCDEGFRNAGVKEFGLAAR